MTARRLVARTLGLTVGLTGALTAVLGLSASSSSACGVSPSGNNVSFAFTTCGSSYGGEANLNFGSGSYVTTGGSSEALQFSLGIYGDDPNYPGFVSYLYQKGNAGGYNNCFLAQDQPIGGTSVQACDARITTPDTPEFKIFNLGDGQWTLYLNGNQQHVTSDLNFNASPMMYVGAQRFGGAATDASPPVSFNLLKYRNSSGTFLPWGSYSHCRVTSSTVMSFVALNFPTSAQMRIGQANSYPGCDGSLTTFPRMTW